MSYMNQSSSIRNAHAGDVLLVVHDFDARSTDELTLRKGDKVELVELDDGFGDGWYLGRHLNRGGTGLFPGVYTTKVPTGFGQSQAPGMLPRASQPIRPYMSQPPFFLQPATPKEPSVDSQYQHTGLADSPNLPSQTPELPSNDVGRAEVRATSAIAPPQSYHAPMQRSIEETLSDPHANRDSPVMNETLSVIDEHMQDMSTPRQSLLNQQYTSVEDSESEYSSNANDRQSYFARTETDEDDRDKLTEAEVKSWDHKQTAEHLRSIGVDPKHCDIFEEQEITGDVLLEMDQAFIYMKEYDFGVMGKRLKTWHKIRDLQEEARSSKVSRQTTSTDLQAADSAENLSHAHSRIGSSGAAILPRIPDLTENPGLAFRSQPPPSSFMHNAPAAPYPLQTQSNAMRRSSMHGSTPPSPWRASMAPDSPSRPSAALVRDISHSRRHSSIDFGNQPPFDIPPSQVAQSTPHKKQASLDRGWTMSSTTPTTASTTAISSRLNTMKQQSTDSSFDPSVRTDPSSVDLDRGYFSGGEVEKRKIRNVLRKRDSQASPVHSRQSSMLEDLRNNPAAAKRHSRLSSVDSVRDMAPKITSSAARAYHSTANKGRMRSASARTVSPLPYTNAVSPSVTNLENESSPNVQFQSPQLIGDSKDGSSPSLAMSSSSNAQNKARKIMGLRAISDAVTGNEKQLITSPGPVTILGESPLDSPTGSNTPSGTSRSFEIDNADTSSKGTDSVGTALVPKTSSRPRPKTKQQTSAYLRGLQKVGPAEARKDCDYSGWMKKKSSSLLTTWKPRLFILRGRRLSYYYSENDTVERGIIDISGHKVLVANSDPMTTFHATITGATSSPTPSSAVTSAETSPTVTKSPGNLNGPFYFKLVPPKAGFSRAVQFTKPTVHYFQVDGLAEGRKWMGELMKATIEHDLSSFETTNKQKTISLAKAKARKERPPALKEEEVQEIAEKPAKDKIDESGLKIQGLSFEKENSNTKSSFEGMFDEKTNGNLNRSEPLPDTGQKVDHTPEVRAS